MPLELVLSTNYHFFRLKKFLLSFQFKKSLGFIYGYWKWGNVRCEIEEVKKVEKTLHVARKTVRDELKKAQDELAAEIAKAKENPDKNEVEIHIKTLVAEQAAARKAALDEFRAAQKEKHEELKAAKKELREEVRNTKEVGESRTSR